MSNTLINQAMKRLLTLGLMLASAFALTNCSEQLVSPDQENDIIVDVAEQEDLTGTPYEVYMDDIETKTAYKNNKTIWNVGDGIALYSRPSTSTGTTTYSRHEKFTYVEPEEDGAKKRFEGFLNGSLASKNDWFFIYPYGTGSSSASTFSETICIGPAIQNQDNQDAMLHLAGSGCPLYGTDMGVKKSDRPHFKMNYLYSVVALKIVNNTNGNIVVSNAEFKATEDIVGDFNVTINGDGASYKSESGKTSSVARVELSSPAPIAKGNSVTLYLAVKPFDASNDKIIVAVNGAAATGNGASRTVTMPADTKFEAGRITTLTVPVEEMSFHYEDVDPATSNVMGVKVQVLDKIDGSIFTGGYKIKYKEGLAVTTSGSSTADVIINGKETKAYVIGTESKVGTISIHGTAQELINYMPMEFYAAAWNNNKAVMRVESVTIHTDLLVAAVLGHKLSLDYGTLTSMMDGGKITFSGLVPLEQITYNGNSKSHMVIIDEEPYHKPISIDKFESLLASFDNNPNDNFKPTFEGLRAALSNPGSLRSSYTLDSENLTEAEITAYTVWKKIDTKVSSSDAMKFAAALTGDVLKSPKGLFEFASKSPIDVVLTTVAKGGEEGATDNRLIFWGLNSPTVK